MSVGGDQRGYFYGPLSKEYQSDRATEDKLTSAQLSALAKMSGNNLTYTCTVPGKGWQSALDDDLDGTLNGDEEQ